MRAMGSDRRREHEEHMDDAELRAKAREILELESLRPMLHSSCGLEFKAAVQCFVLDRSTPKGASCSEDFQQLQSCMLAAYKRSGEFKELVAEVQQREDEFEAERSKAEHTFAQEAFKRSKRSDNQSAV